MGLILCFLYFIFLPNHAQPGDEILEINGKSVLMNEGDDQSENWQRLTRIIKDIKDSLTLTLKLRLQSPSAHAMRASKAQVGMYVCVCVFA